MGKFTVGDNNMYSKMPIFAKGASVDNRDEHAIVDVLGSWIPECEVIVFGLINSDRGNELYKLRNMKRIDKHDLYLDTAYFEGRDLIKYLASKDDELKDLDDEYIDSLIKTAYDSYLYGPPPSETMIRHALIELLYTEFFKSITLVFPWEVRDADVWHLYHIVPQSVVDKIEVTSGRLLDIVGENHGMDKSQFFYSTILTNSIHDTVDMILDPKKYNTSESFFLLRNHSGNTIPIADDNGNTHFQELGNEHILPLLIDVEKGGLPKSKMRFARYEPHLFADSKPRGEGFNIGE